MRCGRRSALGSLLTATALFLIRLERAGAGRGPRTIPAPRRRRPRRPSTARTRLRDQACADAAASAAARDADPTNVEKTAKAAADAAEVRGADRERDQGGRVAGRRQRRHRHRAGQPDAARRRRSNRAAGAVKSDNIEWVSNSRGCPARVDQPERANGNYAGATFIHYENLGYDFMFGDGTGGLAIWSLKDPAKPQYVGGVTADGAPQPADAHGAADTRRALLRG